LNDGEITKGPRPGMIIHAIRGQSVAVQLHRRRADLDRLLGAMADGLAGDAAGSPRRRAVATTGRTCGRGDPAAGWA
jgi:hypothetical protein